MAHPAATLALGVVGFGLLATAAIGYIPGGFGGAPPAPAGSDSAAGNALLTAHFPAASADPTSVLLRFGTPVWSDAGVVARAERRLTAVPSFEFALHRVGPRMMFCAPLYPVAAGSGRACASWWSSHQLAALSTSVSTWAERKSPRL